MLEKIPYDPLTVICAYFTPDEIGELRTVSKRLNIAVYKYSNYYWYKTYKKRFDPDDYDGTEDYRDMCMQQTPYIIPRLTNIYGCESTYKFYTRIFDNNKHHCLKLAAIYAIILFGSSKKNEFHVVEYNPHKNIGRGVSKNKMLLSAFYDLPCDSSYFHLTTLEDKIKPLSFKNSVDSTFMLLKYGTETGSDIIDGMSKNRDDGCNCGVLGFDPCKCSSQLLYKDDLEKMIDKGCIYNKIEHVETKQYSKGKCHLGCDLNCHQQKWDTDVDFEPGVKSAESRFNNLIFDFGKYDLDYYQDDEEYVFSVQGIKGQEFKHAAIQWNCNYIGHREEETREQSYYSNGEYLDEVRVVVESVSSKGYTKVKATYFGIGLL